MSKIIVSNSEEQAQSPFDRILHIDEEGQEFWYARELMKMLGYIKWQNFEKAIDAAIENLEACQGEASGHFLLLAVNSTGKSGRTGVDYKLSRLACYHTVLSCDSKGKPIVKQAKHYFAVKTRQAEEAEAKKVAQQPSWPRLSAIEEFERIWEIFNR